MNLPNPQPVLELIEAFRRSKTMFAAVSMGVFDALHEAPASAADLAVKFGANADAMGRLLDGCAALGLLRKHGGGLRERSRSGDLSLLGQRSLAARIRAVFRCGALWNVGHLEDAVREGTHRWTQSFGSKGRSSARSSVPTRPCGIS